MTNDTFPFKSVYEFLNEYDLLNASDEKIQKAKAHYWKLYRTHYAHQYRRRMKPISVWLTVEEYEQVRQDAVRQGLRPSGHLKRLVLGSRKPSGSSLEVLQGIRRLHSDVLNLVRSKFRRGLDSQQEIHALANKIEDLEDLIKNKD